MLYRKNDLIAKDRYDTLNLDATGAGYLIDKLEIRAAGDYQVDWKAKKKHLVNESLKSLSR